MLSPSPHLKACQSTTIIESSCQGHKMAIHVWLTPPFREQIWREDKLKLGNNIAMQVYHNLCFMC